MMKVLQAEEALTLATAVALGSGNLKPARARRIRSEWVRIMNKGRAAESKQPLEAAGIRVVRKGKDDRETR